MAAPTLDELLQAYGHGYEPAGPAGDPNSLGYALQGPAPSWTTADHLRMMAAQQAAREREGPEAMSNLIATALGAGLGTAAARRAAPRPGSAEWIKQAEQKALFDPGFYDRGITGGEPNVARWREAFGIPEQSWMGSSSELASRPGTTSFGTAPIEQRWAFPANDVRADPRANAAGRALVEQAQKPTAGTTPRSPRQEALARGQEEFHATGPTSSEGARLEYNSPYRAFPEVGNSHPMSGFRSFDPYYQAVTKDFPEAQPPMRALAQDEKGRFYDKNRLNATAGAGSPSAEQERDDLLAWLAKHYPQP